MKYFENLECKGHFLLRSDICDIGDHFGYAWITNQGCHFAIGLMLVLAPLVLSKNLFGRLLPLKGWKALGYALFVLIVIKQFGFDWPNGFWKWQFFVDGCFDLLFVVLGIVFGFRAVAIHKQEGSSYVTESA